MFKIYVKVVNTMKAMQNWNAELAAGKQTFTEVKFQSGIFKGDSLSQILFVRMMIPLNYVLSNFAGGNKATEKHKIAFCIWMMLRYFPQSKKRTRNHRTKYKLLESIAEILEWNEGLENVSWEE